MSDEPKDATHWQRFRETAAAWCDYATHGERGRGIDDPVYKWITEGRDPGPDYSSCADLAHWLLFRMGCREPFVNRAEHLGFKFGPNINRLIYDPIGTCPFAKAVAVKDRSRVIASLERGDILITARSWPAGSDAHAFVFDRFEYGMVHSWDLGQAPMGRAAWQQSRAHLEARRRIKAPAFPLRSVIRLNDVPFVGEVDLPTGERFDALDGGEDDGA